MLLASKKITTMAIYVSFNYLCHGMYIFIGLFTICTIAYTLLCLADVVVLLLWVIEYCWISNICVGTHFFKLIIQNIRPVLKPEYQNLFKHQIFLVQGLCIFGIDNRNMSTSGSTITTRLQHLEKTQTQWLFGK